VVTLLSSDIEEALELLSLSPTHGSPSRPSDPYSSSGSDLFKDWPGANDMAASVYIALSADALSSRASTTTAPHDGQESHAGSSHGRFYCDGPMGESSKT
jgi:hypothetical protein